MYHHLRGKMVEKTPSQAVIEAGGIGYIVRTTSETYTRLPSPGQDCLLYLYLAVRDDAMELFGFATKEERRLFLELVKVKGVGPQNGLAVLSSAPAEELQKAIMAGDVKTLTRARGVGTKLAQRIVLELKGELMLEEAAGLAGTSGPARDAQEALIALGYTHKQAAKAVSAALKKGADAGSADSEALIRRALAEVS